MAKKITIVGKKAERIEQKGRFQRRIEPTEFAAALGAELCKEIAPGKRDPITLAEIGAQLIKRSRSRGGKSPLKDATECCEAPLSAEDIAALESIVGAIGEATGSRPTLGQVAKVILRMHVEELRRAVHGPLPEQPLAG